MFAVAPTYDEMEIRIGRARMRGDRPELNGGRIQRHHALRLNRILPDRHLARSRFDVGDPAKKVFVVRHHALDVDDRAVSRIATHVGNQVFGAIELRIDALGTLPPVAFDVADQRADSIVARCLARDDLRDHAGSAA